MATLSLYNRQKTHRPALPWLRRIIKAAHPLCLAHACAADAPLHELEEIEFTILSDTDIAVVHAEFLDDPTPTDVITFHHGEILVSADTALSQGQEHGFPLNQELALYMIHGLMHLGGWDDHETTEAAEMKERQEAVLAEVLQKHPLPI